MGTLDLGPHLAADSVTIYGTSGMLISSQSAASRTRLKRATAAGFAIFRVFVHLDDPAVA